MPLEERKFHPTLLSFGRRGGIGKQVLAAKALEMGGCMMKLSNACTPPVSRSYIEIHFGLGRPCFSCQPVDLAPDDRGLHSSWSYWYPIDSLIGSCTSFKVAYRYPNRCKRGEDPWMEVL